MPAADLIVGLRGFGHVSVFTNDRGGLLNPIVVSAPAVVPNPSIAPAMNAPAQPILLSCSHYLVGYDRRARANMKSQRALKSWPVFGRDAAMLSHVLRPRFNHKILDVPAGLRDIREQAPEHRSVTVPDRSHGVHGVPKVCRIGRVDLIFDGDHHRACIRLNFAGYVRNRHAAQRF